MILVGETCHRLLFCTQFNIGLRSPASDVRSYCKMIENKIPKDQAACGSIEVASMILNFLHNYDFAEKTHL